LSFDFETVLRVGWPAVSVHGAKITVVIPISVVTAVAEVG